jgi:acetyl-CoA synthetase
MIDTANPNNFDLSSLKTLGTVGQPISPEAWHWVHQNIGRECCPIVDTWWQTESGGILISSFPGATPTKPGAVGLPLFGIKLAVLDPKTGHELKGNNVEGVLTIAEPWPGQMSTLHNHRDQFETTYFKPYPGYYFTGDHCRRDADGYYWILGRAPGQ